MLCCVRGVTIGVTLVVGVAPAVCVAPVVGVVMLCCMCGVIIEVTLVVGVAPVVGVVPAVGTFLVPNVFPIDGMCPVVGVVTLLGSKGGTGLSIKGLVPAAVVLLAPVLLSVLYIYIDCGLLSPLTDGTAPAPIFI